MKTFLDCALDLAALGFPVFPVTAHAKKKPVVKEFWARASTDPDEIRKLWKWDPVMESGESYNPAVSTTFFQDGGLIVLDVDPKHGGDYSLEDLQIIKGYHLPDTYEQHTPSGGTHYVYTIPVACAHSNSELAPGLDIRSHHSYILGAGAAIPEGAYTATVRPVAPAPDWLVEWAQAHPPGAARASQAPHPAAVDRYIALRKAQEYLVSLPPAPDGKRDALAFRAAAYLRELGLSQTDAAEQMVLWFKFDGVFNPAEIEHATESAFKYAKGQAAGLNAERYFAPILEPEAPEPVPPVESDPSQEEEPTSGDLRDVLNRNYAAVMVGNQFRVMWEKKDHKGKYTREFLTTENFEKKLAGETMQSGDKFIELAKAWLRWKRKRAFDGVVFAPGQKLSPSYYNTWRGFAYEPLARGEAPTAGMKEALDMFLTHLRENFCTGIAAHADYVTAFFAHMIQRPQDKPRVALVAKGGKGCGKSTVAQMGGALVEPHFWCAADQRALLGNFNAHMGDTSLFVLEEAVWGGNKSAESVLKDLVTRGHVNIEQKFREVFRADNYMRIMIIGNAEWQVPASLKDERRWAVFNVAMNSMPFDTEADKTKVALWFDRLYTLMGKGGYRYLMTYLLNYDLSGVNINAAPVTSGLVEQIEHTLSPLHQWWLECLRDARIVEGDMDGWPRDVEKGRLRSAFERYCDRRNSESLRPGAIMFGTELHKVCDSMQLDKKNKENNWIYRLPSLPVAREEWEKVVGRAVTWPDSEEF